MNRSRWRPGGREKSTKKSETLKHAVKNCQSNEQYIGFFLGEIKLVKTVVWSFNSNGNRLFIEEKCWPTACFDSVFAHGLNPRGFSDYFANPPSPLKTFRSFRSALRKLPCTPFILRVLTNTWLWMFPAGRRTVCVRKKLTSVLFVDAAANHCFTPEAVSLSLNKMCTYISTLASPSHSSHREFSVKMKSWGWCTW